MVWLILAVVLGTFASCTDNWKLHQVKSDLLTLDLPVGTSEESHSFDDFSYYMTYQAPTQSIIVEVYPWIKSPQQAMDYTAKQVESGKVTDFDYNTVRGVKYEGSNKLLASEIFCFNKDGYTVILSSFGQCASYHTIRDIVRSIQFVKPPFTEKEKSALPVKVAKRVSKQLFKSLSNYRGEAISDSTSWNMVLTLAKDGSLDDSQPPMINIDCWLTPRAMTYLRPRFNSISEIENSRMLYNRLFLFPLDMLGIQMAKDVKMMNDEILIIHFDYYNERGRKIKANIRSISIIEE